MMSTATPMPSLDQEKRRRPVLSLGGLMCVHLQVVFNPKDTNTFASASLDRTVKVCGPGRLPSRRQQGWQLCRQGHCCNLLPTETYVYGRG